MEEQEVQNAKNIMEDLEEKFVLAHNSIVTLVLQDLGDLGQYENVDQEVMVNQILINDENRESINKENPFFDYLYNLINAIITQDGIRFSEFKEKVNSELPTSLDMYDKYLRH